MMAAGKRAATGPRIGEVLELIERFYQRPQAERPAAELADELPELRRACDLLELVFAETAAAFAASDRYDREGSVTPIDWIRHHCHVSGHAAADRVCVGQQLERLPESAEAVAAGQIGFAHLSLIARTASALTESGTSGSFDEGRLLAGALESSVGRFRYLCHHIRHAEDQEGLAAEQRQAHEARRLQLTDCEDGSLAIRGLLDPVGGAALRTALEPLARRRGKDDDR